MSETAESLIDYNIGVVNVTLEQKAKFKYLCDIEGVSVKDKIASMIIKEVKDVKVK